MPLPAKPTTPRFCGRSSALGPFFYERLAKNNVTDPVAQCEEVLHLPALKEELVCCCVRKGAKGILPAHQLHPIVHPHILMDKGLEWLPHTSTQLVRLPAISASARSSLKGTGKTMSWNTVGKRLKGCETVMDTELAPEDLEAYMKRWALKWHYFQETFPETLQYDVDGMGRDEMHTHIIWLEGEFTQISDEILCLQEHAVCDSSWWKMTRLIYPSQTNYKILAGSLFVTNLIQDCQSDLVSVLTTSKTNGNNSTLMEEEHVALGNQVGQPAAESCGKDAYVCPEMHQQDDHVEVNIGCAVEIQDVTSDRFPVITSPHLVTMDQDPWIVQQLGISSGAIRTSKYRGFEPQLSCSFGGF
ncbi:hypothetical protein DFH07DRAFT_780447 [Mycena maculata]|uniref:Uncharacterized protein n=1 Tax=Mycena maculata TaxID=230809 RepID=A0AAD7I4L3_9AGAR|nr:hypothetical protein DFH07DRAFT_780447 [Mycena maculata]